MYFTAANEQLLDLNSETMPFYSNGVLYVSSRVFEGGELGLSYGRNTTLGLATLYRQGSNMDLRFDIAGQVVYDKQYNMYNGYAIERGGEVFFPLELVCRYFRLSWSYNETETAPLIRVKSDNVILSDVDFINAAATLMRGRYDDFERAAASRPPVLPDTPARPEQIAIRRHLSGCQQEGPLGLLQNGQYLPGVLPVKHEIDLLPLRRLYRRINGGRRVRWSGCRRRWTALRSLRPGCCAPWDGIGKT